MRKLIGYALLARLYALLWIGRTAQKIAIRYGYGGGLGDCLMVEIYRAGLYEKYGLRRPADPVVA